MNINTAADERYRTADAVNGNNDIKKADAPNKDTGAGTPMRIRTPSERERFTIFLLSYVDTIGSETIKKADSRLDSISDILKLKDGELKNELGMRENQISGLNMIRKKKAQIEKEYEMMLRSDIRFCTFRDEDYPARLRAIPQSPAVLYSYGPLPEDCAPAVGIVGSRACTGYGASVAENFGEVLAENGVNVISGMAVGIDAAAHRGALKTGTGKTHAVLAGGVNVIYPRENKYIYDEIIMGHRGSVISESIPGKAAISRNFPMRNRIISGLSDAVVIVEAKEKSGSLITAVYAGRQNVPVMAVPGRINDPMSRGTNMLISRGAQPVCSPEEILEKLKLSCHTVSTDCDKTVKLLDKHEKIVYSTLVSDPKHIEMILHETGLTGESVLDALLSLELKGFAGQVSSNYYIRR